MDHSGAILKVISRAYRDAVTQVPQAQQTLCLHENFFWVDRMGPIANREPAQSEL